MRGGERRDPQGSGASLGERSTPKQRDRRLRRTVCRLRQCLSGLPATERRVLVLRADLGAARTRSRREVARITGLSRARVARVETGGLRRLARLARTSACAAPWPAVDRSSEAAGGPGAGAAGPAPPGLPARGLLSPFAGAGDAAGIGVLGEHRTGTPDSGGGSSSSGSGWPIGPPGSGDPSGSELLIALVAMMVLTGLVLAAPRLRRARHRHHWDPRAPW